MAFNFNFSFGRTNVSSVERSSNGTFTYILDNVFNRKKYITDKAKIDLALTSPAVLFVLSKLSDITSQVHIDKWLNDKLQKKNYIYSLSKQPNEWQTWTEWFWDWRFYLALGNAYLYKDGEISYWLNSSKIKLTERQKEQFEKLSFSKYGQDTKRNILNQTFEYEINNKMYQLKLSNLHILSDLSKSINGSWFEGSSRIDALLKVIDNSEIAVESKGINLFFTQKFLVGEKNKLNDYQDAPLSDKEKLSVESSVLNKSKNVHAVNTQLELKHFVDSLNQLELDNHFIADVTMIGAMYGLDKQMLGFENGTYENQEKSLGKFINYNEMPKIQQLTDLLEILYQEEDLRGNFDHLPFNEVFKIEKSNNRKIDIESLKISAELGMDKNLVNQKLNDLWN